MIPSTLLAPAGLLLYGWSAQARVHWIVPIIGTAFIGFSLMATTGPSNSYLVDAFGIYASFTARNVVATVLPLVGSPLYARMGVGWGNTVLAGIATLFAPLPLTVLRHGRRMRSRSKRWAENTVN